MGASLAGRYLLACTVFSGIYSNDELPWRKDKYQTGRWLLQTVRSAGLSSQRGKTREDPTPRPF